MRVDAEARLGSAPSPEGSLGRPKKGERATVVSLGGGKPEKKGVVTFADSPVGVVITGTGYYFASSDGVSSF